MTMRPLTKIEQRPTTHEKNEWSRMATAAYAAGRNDVGHRYSAAASLAADGVFSTKHFDELQEGYRAWLVDGTLPPAAAEVVVDLTYTIQINDYQRRLLLAVIKSVPGNNALGGMPGDVEETAIGEAVILMDMLEAMPGEEEGCPGAVHGFCL